jgi:hypothetical protein
MKTSNSGNISKEMWNTFLLEWKSSQCSISMPKHYSTLTAPSSEGTPDTSQPALRTS